MNRIVVLGAVLLSASATGLGVAGAATVTVNTAVRKVTIQGVPNTEQTIDGFGVFGSMHPWWGRAPFYTDNFLSMYIDTLGLTLLRTELYPQPDQTSMYTQQIPYLRAIMAKAQASHEPLKVFASIWSPPGNMKTGGSTNGGSLLTDSLDAYGVYVANYVKKFNSDMGYNLYAISPQNEPALCTSYNSACYMPSDFAPVVIHVAHAIRDQNVPVWMHYADNVVWGTSGQQGPVIAQVCQDRVADSIGSIMSCHYTQSGEADSGSTITPPYDPNRDYYYWFFKQAQGIDTGTGGEDSRHYNKGKKSRMWNTEWGGYFGVWSDDFQDESSYKPGGAWTCARHLFFALKSGFNAITYWQGCDDAGNDTTPFTNPTRGQHYAVMYNYNGAYHAGPLFYVLKSFYRYIRPGAIRVSCASSDSNNVNALAFTHDSLSMTTVVLLNYATTPQLVQLTGTGLPSVMNVYQTSPTQNCVSTGTVASGGTITLPVHSVTTVCNTAAVSVQPAAAPAGPSGAAMAMRGFVATRYGLDGRRLRPAAMANRRPENAQGVVVVDRTGMSPVKHVVTGR